MSRKYVDNKMNRELGRVGLPVGSAVHSPSSSSYQSSSSSHRAYVDNSLNRQLGRVGQEIGTAIHSRSETPKRYVDNPMNQKLGRVDMEYGTAVHSNSSSSHRAYVDNPLNRQLGRVGQEIGTAIHSRSETPKRYVDNPMNQKLGRVDMEYGTAVHSKSETPKRYKDNPMNQKLGRVGMEHGTAVHSKSETPKINVANARNGELGRFGMAFGIAVHSSVESEKRVYVDNAFNRKHNRVGLPLGSVPISRKNELYNSYLNRKQQEASPVNSNEKLSLTQHAHVGKVYVDNPFNRKHNRVGLPLGSVPISRKKEVHRDTARNREPDRVVKSRGTAAAPKKNKLAELYKHLEEHSDEEIPEEFECMSDDAFSYVLEFRQRQEAVRTFLEETVCKNWQPHEHTSTETIKKYQGKIIDYEKLHIVRPIGHGGFGEVFLASLENGEAVAVKKLKSQQVTKKRIQMFKKEMDLFLTLDHINIVSFIGACIEVPNLAIIMEFMDMSLFDALHLKEVDFTVSNKLEMTKGVTNGLAYLHSKDIAHCDLKSKNVLLINVPGEDLTDSSKPVRAKITDFGLSKMKSDMVTSNSLSAANIGTPLYSAPEIHQGEILSLEGLKKADIFSLGLLIWELAVQEIPFEDLTLEQLKVQVGEKGQAPVSSENLKLDRKLQETLSLCWSMNPNKRPTAETMAEIASTFTNVLEEKEE